MFTLPRPAVRLAVAALTTFGAGALAVLAFQALEGRASAKAAAASASTIYVPPGGLAFRALNGRVFARLSYDSHGGVFELYDEHEERSSYVGGSVVPPQMFIAPRSAGGAPVDLGY